ncbi:copper amine oxidase N-terminal domain-containing protein [Paenibacillus sp. 22594]|uniref:copper amine oxidase N-terminal domain-containing protein n=1 Tax=Paenibacillus sp. 22594 TaxID=3453947 RepID=UPI003F858B9E
MTKFLRTGVLLLSIFFLASGAAMAAPTKIAVIVNDATVNTDVAPYIKGGTTIVPLNVVQQIPGISVKWDNASKTITITRKGETVTLVAGQKFATIGSKKVALSVSSSLENGRVMVPLRFIAESANAHIIWNANTRTIYVAKASDALTTQLTSKNLAEARSAAVQYPKVSLLKNFSVTNDSQNQDYYFPQGKSNQFFILGGNGISYYEIVGNHSEQLWTAQFDPSAKSSNELFFLPYKITNQDGSVPTLNSRVAFYHLMLPIMEATYGFIETNGQTTSLGQKEIKLNRFFEIPEEQ